MSQAKKTIIEITVNRKAYHDYEMLSTYEAGIELTGTEIKSIRDHAVNLKDSFVLIRDGEAWVHNMHISPYGHGNIFNHDPTRKRRLLLHKREILKLSQAVQQKGLTIVPIKLYIKGKYAKLEIAVARGKKLHDKKSALKERDIKRDMDREIRNFR
ncbi:MAG: SsrA-binding protein SmpB [Brevinematales bacterium]